MKNVNELKEKYDNIYLNNNKKYFSKYINGEDISETNKIILNNLPNLTDKVVVDLGCGEGELINIIAKSGAKKAIGIDYSQPAIEIARNKFCEVNLNFECSNIDDFNEQVDIFITNGTLEHLDSPAETLKHIKTKLKKNGLVFITCPHFYNLRGFIWITLNKLLNVPMSLTDIHNITPFDIEKWAAQTGFTLLKQESYDLSRANGELMINDMDKRLTNALRDSNLENHKVSSLLDFCSNFFEYQKKYPQNIKLEGMSKLYILSHLDS
jgi:2-polyprenyl-3-methyl-5-hydroxy-6-metoxy-1,4-benzoquinol methylase